MDKKQTPLVSIVVPVYHVGAYLHQCVDSILNQTYQNIELILVDDGGDDECPAICDQYVAQDGRVFCIHKKNEGQSLARKAGTERAGGDYFMFVDGDDWLEQNAVEDSLKIALEQCADVVCFGYKRIYIDNVFETSVFPWDGELRMWEQGEIADLQRRIIGLTGIELAYVEAADRMAPMWGKLYSSDVVSAGKWISEREVGSSEDALFNLYALSACKRFVYINQYLYCYRKTNTYATTRAYRKDMVEKWEALFDYFRQHIVMTKDRVMCENALNNRIALSILGIGLNELNSERSFFQKAQYLRNVTEKSQWQRAYDKLEFRYFPPKWKVFFFLCKHKQTELLLIMLYSINWLKKWLKK